MQIRLLAKALGRISAVPMTDPVVGPGEVVQEDRCPQLWSEMMLARGRHQPDGVHRHSRHVRLAMERTGMPKQLRHRHHLIGRKNSHLLVDPSSLMMDQDEPEAEDAFYSEDDSFFERLLKMSLDPAWENELTLAVLQHDDSDRLAEGLTLADLPDLFAKFMAASFNPWDYPRWPQFSGSGLTDDQIDLLEPDAALLLLNRIRANAGKPPLIPPERDGDPDDFDQWILDNFDKR